MRSWLVAGLLWTTPALSIEGTVRYVGPVPALAPHAVAKDQSVCGASQPDESLQLSPRNGLKNAVVFVDRAPATATPAAARTVQIDQRGCRYSPHVLAALAGDTLELVNSDPILHNANARDGNSTVFNVAFPIRGQQRRVALSRTGVMHLGCNAGHPWMSSWIHVFNHPFFAVTDDAGHFHIDGLPDGDHMLNVWHERLGTTHALVHVGPGAKPVEISFTR